MILFIKQHGPHCWTIKGLFRETVVYSGGTIERHINRYITTIINGGK